MMLLFLACAAGPESSSEPNLPPIPRVTVTEGSCTMYPDFQVNPTATIIVITCLPAEEGMRCGAEPYRIRADGRLTLEDCEGGNAAGTWRITQILE